MKALKYRKKPVVIEAMVFTGTLEAAQEIAKWMGKPFDWIGTPDVLEIPTLEGIMTATKGDFIIKGIKGEFYPCKPDIFLSSYEIVK